MFTRKHRATTTTVTAALKRGKTKQSQYFSVRYTPTDTTKIAVVVSKKVQKTAVGRNKLKRRIRAAIAPSTLKPGTYVVYAKRGAQELSPNNIHQELGTILH